MPQSQTRTFDNVVVEYSDPPVPELSVLLTVTPDNANFKEDKASSDGAWVKNASPLGSRRVVAIKDFAGNQHYLDAGETLQKLNGRWARVASAASGITPVTGSTVSTRTALKLIPMTFGDVDLEASHIMGVVPQQASTSQLVLLDSNVPEGAVVKNMTNAAVKSEIQIRMTALGLPSCCIRNGEHAEKVNGQWKVSLNMTILGNTTLTGSHAYPTPSPVALNSIVFSHIAVDYSQTANLKFPHTLSPGADMEVTDLGCAKGDIIKNRPPTNASVRISCPRGTLLQVIYSGEEAKFDGRDWVLVGTVGVGQPVKFGVGQSINLSGTSNPLASAYSGQWAGVFKDNDAGPPVTISAFKFKKCTCGNLNHGACSTWCDLVRTDV